MIVNPAKFQAIILSKKISNVTNIKINLLDHIISSMPQVELYGIQHAD